MFLKTVLVIFGVLASGINSIKVSDCGSQSVNLLKFEVSHDKIQSNSVVHLTSHFDIIKEINGPVNLEVTVKRKVWFTYVTVPCVKKMGSCTYNNGCEELKNIIAGKGCPPEIIQSGLSCTCPMHAGEVRINNHPIKIPDIGGVMGSMAKGKYKVNAKLRNPNTGEVHLCLDVEAELK